jgi:hypothetical protein
MVSCYENIKKTVLFRTFFVAGLVCASLIAPNLAAAPFDASAVYTLLSTPANWAADTTWNLSKISAFTSLQQIDVTAANAAMAALQATVTQYAAQAQAAPAGSPLATAYTSANTYVTTNTPLLAANPNIANETAKLQGALTALTTALNGTITTNAATALTSAKATAAATIDAVVTKIQAAQAALVAAQAVFTAISAQASAAGIAVPPLSWTTTPTTYSGPTYSTTTYPAPTPTQETSTTTPK